MFAGLGAAGGAGSFVDAANGGGGWWGPGWWLALTTLIGLSTPDERWVTINRFSGVMVALRGGSAGPPGHQCPEAPKLLAGAWLQAGAAAAALQ